MNRPVPDVVGVPGNDSGEAREGGMVGERPAFLPAASRAAIGEIETGWEL